MKTIKVLGSGCGNCKTTFRLIDEVARAMGVEISLEKVEALSEIMAYGVMSTPAVVLDGQVVHAGGIPSAEAIASWLEHTATAVESRNMGSGSGGCCCEQRP